MITLDDLRAICPHTKAERLDLFVDPVNAAMDEFEVSANPARETHFLAQIAHESMAFQTTRELASGDAYEGRADLGNTQPGDGRRYRGRGLIQVTGKTNYADCGEALALPLLDRPELLEEPLNAARSAGWFWKKHGLNELADRDDIKAITKRINGGYNGLQERIAYLDKAKEILA